MAQMLKDLKPANVITLVIAVYFAAAVLPDAISAIFAVDTSNWSTVAQTLFDLAPLGLVAGIVLLFAPKGGNS